MGRAKGLGRWTSDAVLTFLALHPEWKGDLERMAWNTLGLTYYHWWMDLVERKQRAMRNRNRARNQRGRAALLARAINKMEAECGVAATWASTEVQGADEPRET